MSRINILPYPIIAKFLACASVACGVTASPFLFSDGRKEQIKEKRKKSLVLGRSNNQKKNELSLSNIENINKLLSGQKNKLNFGEIGMKFGNKSLSANDILFSPCQDGNFYLMQSIDVTKMKYKLENGEVVQRTPRCQEKTKYENSNRVKLNWQSSQWSGNTSLSSITLGSCSLSTSPAKQGDKNFKLQMICSEFLKGGSQAKGEYGEDSYEYDS
ncbi:hypothetical protein OVS_01760 [Mycoplasma ovis str. Michigan]|uniref:Lipoprotein n=1 Tax=Mycoplasma ovis str. Michigan TaxID=1415773 RepID=A0ABM5P1A8_9MOLU|nr:hypothetical protein [Mycoplasma ovis]AHC40237.1 hypothetical protein OVS_01760 [Mycoplasma ovis str. Michigan]